MKGETLPEVPWERTSASGPSNGPSGYHFLPLHLNSPEIFPLQNYQWTFTQK